LLRMAFLTPNLQNPATGFFFVPLTGTRAAFISIEIPFRSVRFSRKIFLSNGFPIPYFDFFNSLTTTTILVLSEAIGMATIIYTAYCNCYYLLFATCCCFFYQPPVTNTPIKRFIYSICFLIISINWFTCSINGSTTFLSKSNKSP